MMAKKCDRCSKLYEEYNTENDERNINRIGTYNDTINSGYYKHGPYDLCPECSEEFVEWLFGLKEEE